MTDKSGTHRFDPPPSFWGLIALAFAVVGVGFWFLFHAKIARAVLVWKHWQLQQLGRFTRRWAMPRRSPACLMAARTATTAVRCSWACTAN